MGLSINTGKAKPTPKNYQELLNSIQQRPDSHLIQTVLLRSLSQAVYHPENEGHFGLAYKAYTHFTSPIRRYPDLLVHRAIRSVIRSEQECSNATRADGAKPLAKADIYPYDMAQVIQQGEHCSMTERRADDATRDVNDFLKCEYIQDRIGEVFEGVITAVTGFGLFVELKNVYVEGLVHISSLANDFYQFDAVKHRLVGERTRRTFRLGDSLWVQVSGVNLDERKVDFDLATAPGNAGRAMPEPPRLPRRRSKTAAAGAGVKTGAAGVKEEVLKPSGRRRKKPAAAAAAPTSAVVGDTASADKEVGARKKSRKKSSSKRQKLNAKKAPAGTAPVAAKDKPKAASKAKKAKRKAAPKAKSVTKP